MRPIVSGQNSLRFPLNELLGTQAHVRLLRVLVTEFDGPISSSDAAQRAGLTLRGAQKAFNSLVESGFVEKIGGGRRQQYALRRNEKLVQTIVKLFYTESSRYEELFLSIKNTIEIQQPPPIAVWIQEIPRKTGDPLILGVMHETRSIYDYIQKLRDVLITIEKDYDVSIELKGYTKADSPDLSEEKIVPIYGVTTWPGVSSPKTSPKPESHQETDSRLRELAGFLATHIKKDPSIIHRAKEYVNRLILQKPGSATGDIVEWRNILASYSIHRLSCFLTSSGERSARLRQSCPLFAVLTTQERDRLLNNPGRNHDPQTT